MSGNYLVSGAYKDTEGASDQGSAYIYFLTGNTLKPTVHQTEQRVIILEMRFQSVAIMLLFAL